MDEIDPPDEQQRDAVKRWNRPDVLISDLGKELDAAHGEVASLKAEVERAQLRISEFGINDGPLQEMVEGLCDAYDANDKASDRVIADLRSQLDKTQRALAESEAKVVALVKEANQRAEDEADERVTGEAASLRLLLRRALPSVQFASLLPLADEIIVALSKKEAP